MMRSGSVVGGGNIGVMESGRWFGQKGGSFKIFNCVMENCVLVHSLRALRIGSQSGVLKSIRFSIWRVKINSQGCY